MYVNIKKIKDKICQLSISVPKGNLRLLPASCCLPVSPVVQKETRVGLLPSPWGNGCGDLWWARSGRENCPQAPVERAPS